MWNGFASNASSLRTGTLSAAAKAAMCRPASSRAFFSMAPADSSDDAVEGERDSAGSDVD